MFKRKPKIDPYVEPPCVVPVEVGSETVPVLLIKLSLEVLEKDQAFALASIDTPRAEHSVERVLVDLPKPGSPSYISRWFFRGIHVIAHDMYSKGGVFAVAIDDGNQKEPVRLPRLEPSTAFSYLSLSPAIPEQERLAIVATIPVPRVLQPTDDWN